MSANQLPVIVGGPNTEEHARRVLKNKASWPFDLTETALRYRDDSSDELTWHYLCPRIEVLADTRDAKGENWGRLIGFKDRDGRWHEFAAPMAQITRGPQGEIIAHLAYLGFEVPISAKGKTRLLQYLSEAEPYDRFLCVSQIGWYGDIFVLPDVTLGNDISQPVLFQPDNVGCDHNYRTKGPLDEWREHVAKPCQGNSRLVLALSSAFVGPLLHLTGFESGGLHLRGPSSIGKSTALDVAGSVWGGGSIRGFAKSWRATDNGLEAIAASHNDRFLCLDELGEADGRAAEAAAYMLANGQGKTRANRYGGARTSQRWRTFFLSTGEIGLSDKIAEDGRGRRARAGQEIRILDVPADAGKGLGAFEVLHGAVNPAEFAQSLKAATADFYGTPAIAFLEFIAADPEKAATFLKRCIEELVAKWVPEGADGQIHRAVQRFALIAAAGELARSAGVLPWQDGEAAKASEICFKAWLDTRGGIDALEICQAIDRLKCFLEKHGSARFEDWNNTCDQKVLNRAGFRKRDDAGAWCYFLTREALDAEIIQGSDRRTIVNAFCQRSLIIPDKDGKPAGAHKPPACGKTIRLYQISSTIFEEGND